MIRHGAVLVLFVVLITVGWAEWPVGLTYIDVTTQNTRAVSGDQYERFITEDFDDPNYLEGDLWRFRSGKGLSQGGLNGVFEKNHRGGANAPTLVTTLTNLDPTEEYAVYVGFIAKPGQKWRASAGLSPEALANFQPDQSMKHIVDLGPMLESDSRQYLAWVGNASPSIDGMVQVYLDGASSINTGYTRTMIDAVAVGPKVGTVLAKSGLPATAVQLAEDSVWTWFNSPRACFFGGNLYFGFNTKSRARPSIGVWDAPSPPRAMLEYNFSEGTDLNSPAILSTGDTRLLALTSRYSRGDELYVRRSKLGAPFQQDHWLAENQISLNLISRSQSIIFCTFPPVIESIILFDITVTRR